jgi:hypothetical protein
MRSSIVFLILSIFLALAHAAVESKAYKLPDPVRRYRLPKPRVRARQNPTSLGQSLREKAVSVAPVYYETYLHSSLELGHQCNTTCSVLPSYGKVLISVYAE